MSFRASALQVGMPMFFHIAGRAHALSRLTGLRKTLSRQARRLLLPFVVCYLLLIPPWQYIDKEYDWDNPGSFRMKANPIAWLLDYYTSYEMLIYFDMAWLWFLPALFFIVAATSPLLLLAERYQMATRSWTYSSLAAALWAGLFALLVSLGFGWLFALFAVLGPVSGVLISQALPLPPHGAAPGVAEAWDGPSAVRAWLALHLQTAVQIACSVGLVLSFGYKDIDPPREDGAHDPRAAVPFIMLCTGFYAQGYFCHRWSEGCEILESSAPWWIHLYRLIAVFVVILLLMVSSPLGDVEDGHFIYPIYSATYSRGAGFGPFYVLGTWCYIGIIVSLFQAYGDHMITESFYKHATKSTLVVYIFHWVFVKVFAFWMLYPTLHDHGHVVSNPWAAILILLFAYAFAVGGSLGVYALLIQCPGFGGLFGL